MRKPNFKLLFERISNGVYNYVGSIKESINIAFVDNRDGGAPSRRRILFGNIFANMVAIMTGGVFFTGLILILLKDEPEAVRNTYVGNIVSIQTACGLAQIFAPMLIERLKVRKYFVLASRMIYYFINIFAIALVPLLPFDAKTNVNIFIALIVIMQISVSVSNPALTVWHYGNLPDDRRTDYLSIQSMSIPTINAVLGIVCSMFVDRFKAGGAELTGILILRGIAIFLIAAESLCFFRVKEPVYQTSQSKISLRSIFTAPFHSPWFILMTLVNVIWTFVVSIGGQYFTIYLLNDVKMSYTFINFISIFNIPILLLMMPIWNRIIKRIGWLPTLTVSVFLFSLTQVGNLFISERTPWVYAACCIFCNFVSPGYTLAFANLPYLKIPQESQSSCLAFYSTAGSLAGLAGVLFGKYFMAWTEGRYLDLFGFHMKNYVYVYALVFLMLVALCAFIIVLNRREKAKMKQEAAQSPT